MRLKLVHAGKTSEKLDDLLYEVWEGWSEVRKFPLIEIFKFCAEVPVPKMTRAEVRLPDDHTNSDYGINILVISLQFGDILSLIWYTVWVKSISQFISIKFIRYKFKMKRRFA